jgi:hypothetical protein
LPWLRNGYLHGGGAAGARAVEAPGLGEAAAAAGGLGFSTKRLDGNWRMELYITPSGARGLRAGARVDLSRRMKL